MTERVHIIIALQCCVSFCCKQHEFIICIQISLPSWASFSSCWASPMAQWVKNPPAMQEIQETWVQSLGWEDPLEKEMATRSSILALKPHGQRNLEGYSPCDSKEWDTTKHADTAHPAKTSQSTELCSLFHSSFPLAVYFTDQIRSVTQSCPTLCEPVNRSTPGLPVHHQLLEFTQTHVHRVNDATQPSHPLSSPSPPAPNPSQHQSLPMSQLFTWGGQSTLSIRPTLSFPTVSTVCSLCLHLYSCPSNRLICTILLDSIYRRKYTIFVFLFLIYFTPYDRLWVHSHHYKWPTLRSLNRFEFIFVYGVRKCSYLIVLHVASPFFQHHLLKGWIFFLPVFPSSFAID